MQRDFGDPQRHLAPCGPRGRRCEARFSAPRVWTGLLATLAVLLAGCAVPTEVADPVPGRTARGEPAAVPPRSDVVSAGGKLWQTTLQLRDGDTQRVQVEGDWYAASLLHEDGSMTSVLGDSRDGGVTAEWTLTGISGWPLMVADGKRSGLLSIDRPGGSGSQTLVFRGGDGRTFRLAADVFAAEAQDTLKVEAAEGRLAVIRRAGPDRSHHGNADLLVVDTRDRRVLWEADVAPRRIDVAFGMLTADYHSSGDPQAPSDRVRTWDLATGDVLVDMALDHSRVYPPLPCSVAMSEERLLLCGLDDAGAGRALLVTNTGKVIVERSVTAPPAPDRGEGIVAVHLPGGEVEALDVETGSVVWGWNAEDADSRILYGGRDSFLLGSWNADNLVVDSATGELLLVEPFFRLPDPQWNGSVVVRFERDGLVARSGPGPVLGYTADSSLMFWIR